MTLESGWPTFVVILVVTWLATNLLARRETPELGNLLRLAFVAHVVGTLVRYYVVFFTYGTGDSANYYLAGLGHAEKFHQGDFSALDPVALLSGQILGSDSLRLLSGITLAIIGDSLAGECLVFGLLAFAGLWLFVTAYRAEGHSPGQVAAYARLVLFWPSLCFWPSIVGKEALVLFGFGLTMRGYIGVAGRTSVLPALGGLSLVVLVRPHFAGMLAVGLAAGSLLGRGQGRIVSRVVGLLLAAVFVMRGAAQLGIDPMDADAIETFVQDRAGQTAQGGSSIERGAGAGSVVLGIINVLARPFPWEAHNSLAMIAALEVLAFWGLAWIRRRACQERLRRWRDSPLLVSALSTAVLLSVAMGVTFFNLGILSRQRVAILPFLFVLLAAGTAPETDPRPQDKAFAHPGANWQASCSARPVAGEPKVARTLRVAEPLLPPPGLYHTNDE